MSVRSASQRSGWRYPPIFLGPDLGLVPLAERTLVARLLVTTAALALTVVFTRVW